MAREMVLSGVAEISKMLEKAGAQAQKVAAQGLYVGAGIVADAITEAIEEIKTEPFEFADESDKRWPSPEEQECIRGTSGISYFLKDGEWVATFVGFHESGYTYLKGKRVPVGRIANSINSGTSFMQKQPFVRKAVRKVKAQASQAIANEIDRRLKDILEDN